MIGYALSLLSPSTNDVYLSSAHLNISSGLNSAYINDLSVNSVKASNNIVLLKSSVKNHVEAILGHVEVTSSSICGNITAGSWVKLEDSSVQDVVSSLGPVSCLNSKMQNVAANNDIILQRSSVDNRVYSAFGSVSSHHSTLGKVYAHGDIELFDSMATSLTSSLGRVSVKQTISEDTKPILLLRAYKDVNLENCDLHEVACREKAVIKNCSLSSLYLYINNPEEEAVLDLQGTLVKEKIIVESNSTFLKNALALFFNFIWTGSTLPLSQFTLFIIGEELPKNIDFVGFQDKDLSFEKAARNGIEGTLVKGKKGLSLFKDFT